MTALGRPLRLPSERQRPRETDAEWQRRTAPRQPGESDSQYYRRKLGECPRHPFHKPGRTLCLSVEGDCPACAAVLEWRALDLQIRAMEADEARARQAERLEAQRRIDRALELEKRRKPLRLFCSACGARCELCARLRDRKCCPDCACGPWCDLPPRQPGLPFEQRTLDLETMLNPEALSSYKTVTGKGGSR